MPPMHPLRFKPLFRRYLWGGRRLEAVLGKPLGAGDDYAESWEVVDRGEDQSRVVYGPLTGRTLGELVRDRGPALLGRHAPQPRFPLLLKFLDCQRDLSVQVHPNDDQARRLDPPDLGKTEAWVILDAAPESRIYSGLKRGFDRPAFEREIRRGTCALCLHSFHPQPGDCVFIPAGTVHALGAGLLVAEIQQSSDTTYRVFDWNRVGPDGQARPLHIDQALEVIDYDRGPVMPQVPQATDRPHVERLVASDKFQLDRWTFDAPAATTPADRFHLICVLEGEVDIENDPANMPLSKGQSALLPACLGATTLTPRGPSVLLDVYLPE